MRKNVQWTEWSEWTKWTQTQNKIMRKNVQWSELDRDRVVKIKMVRQMVRMDKVDTNSK